MSFGQAGQPGRRAAERPAGSGPVPATLTDTHDYAAAAAGAGPFTGVIAVSAVGVRADGSAVPYAVPHAALAVVPLAPTGLSATESLPGEVDLTWAEPSAVADGYTVRATPPAGAGLPPVTVTVPAGSDGAAVTGLAPGVAYTFTVVAVATAANGGLPVASDPAAATLTATAVALTASAPAVVDEGQPVTVTFAAPAGPGSPIVSWHLGWSDGTEFDRSGYAPGATVAAEPYAFPGWAAHGAENGDGPRKPGLRKRGHY